MVPQGPNTVQFSPQSTTTTPHHTHNILPHPQHLTTPTTPHHTHNISTHPQHLTTPTTPHHSHSLTLWHRWAVHESSACKLRLYKSEQEEEVVGEVDIVGGTFVYDAGDVNGQFKIW